VGEKQTFPKLHMIANRMKIEQIIARCRTDVKEKLDRKTHGRSLRGTGMFGGSLLSEDSENTISARMQSFGEGYSRDRGEYGGVVGSEPKFRTRRIASWPGLRYALGRGSVDEYGLAQARMRNESYGDEVEVEEDEASYDDVYEEEEEEEEEGVGIDEHEHEDPATF